MTYDHLFDVLVKAYTSHDINSKYSGRWDVWLIQNGHFSEYMQLILKTDEQLTRIIKEAQARAEQINNSPLVKALK